MEVFYKGKEKQIQQTRCGYLGNKRKASLGRAYQHSR